MSNKLGFYAIADLNASVVRKVSWPELEQAVKMFKMLEDSNDSSRLSVLGVETSTGAIDLVHKVNGENVLVEDYLRIDDSFSVDMRKNKEAIEGVVKELIDTGVVTHKYNHTIVPWTDLSSIKVLVPIVPNFVPDSYCNDKILKAGDGIPATAINEILVDGHGWVKYGDFLKDPGKFGENSVLKVERVNVAYVKNDQLVGVNGQMDLSVENFEAMADKVHNPYYISVSDKHLEGAKKHANVDKLISEATKTSQETGSLEKGKTDIEKEFDN